MKRLSWFVLLAFVVSCGGTEEKPAQTPSAEVQTPFGSVAAVRAYRQQIEPLIRAVTTAQALVERGVGTTGKATAPNLAAAMGKARPQLQAAYEDFKKIQPPGRLRQLHDKIGELMMCRLQAYDLTIEGSQMSPAAQQSSGWEGRAEAQLARANDLIRELNGQLQAVDAALQTAAAPQVASP